MFIQQFTVISMRTIAGIVLGIMLASLGYALGWVIWWGVPFSPRSAIPFMITFSGFGGMLGAFFGWMRLDAGRAVILTGLGVAFIGGIGGAWGGYLYGKIAYADVVGASGGAFGGVLRVLSHEIDRPTATAIFMGAAIGSNILPFLNGLMRARRYQDI